MIVVFLRAVILYVVVLVSLRVMGKGELGELQPFDLVISLMIAELAALPVSDLNSPMSHGITAIATLVFLQCLISFISLKSNKLRKIICGTPSVLINHGEFNFKEMKKLRVNVNDVLGQLRLKGYNSIEGIDYMIMETSGQMSVIASNTIQDKKIKRVPITVILDGEIMYNNFDKYNLSRATLDFELEKQKLELNDVIYGVVDENDKYIIYKKNN
jgi:uncharacterized membrane protein YcaP (DUF421 family)